MVDNGQGDLLEVVFKDFLHLVFEQPPGGCDQKTCADHQRAQHPSEYLFVDGARGLHGPTASPGAVGATTL